ncbi:MAG: Uma2 family endonuclease [bacterium]
MTQARSKPMTAEELLERGDQLSRCELVRGEIVEMVPAGYDHGDVAFAFGLLIGQFVREHGLGKVFAAETGFLLERNPDTVRAPDVAFIRSDRLSQGPHPGFFEGAPDLAVEVVSPNDSASAITAKVEDWLHHGTDLVWVADPQTRTVTAYTRDHHATIYHLDDTLPGEPVLTGFQLPLGELFKR